VVKDDDLAITNAHLAVLGSDAPAGADSLVVRGGVIDWVGAAGEGFDHAASGLPVVDCGGRLLTPGLVDCHTHLIFAGERCGEFEQRLEGASYADISRAGGGIAATVRATRAASYETLLDAAAARLAALSSSGVTTVEIKSGYGLDRDTELKMLRVARELGASGALNVVTSYLGAHALPPEFADDRDGYLDLICNEVLPACVAENLLDAVDGFCETIAFSAAEMSRVFDVAQAHGLPIKLHAEQLSNMGGTRLAAGRGALSADHLEFLDSEGVAALAASATVAVLLPGAFYYLGETQAPPVAQLRAAGVPIAIATDLNPGSSPVYALTAAMNMACVLFGLTPNEVLRGVTVNAARALGLHDRGELAPGKRADLALWDVGSSAQLVQPMGAQPLVALVIDGRCIRGTLQ